MNNSSRSAQVWLEALRKKEQKKGFSLVQQAQVAQVQQMPFAQTQVVFAGTQEEQIRAIKDELVRVPFTMLAY